MRDRLLALYRLTGVFFSSMTAVDVLRLPALTLLIRLLARLLEPIRQLLEAHLRILEGLALEAMRQRQLGGHDDVLVGDLLRVGDRRRGPWRS